MVEYTVGGSTIFYPTYKIKKTKGQRNKRFKCKSCNHSTTRNQLKINGGHCQNCKTIIITSGTCSFCNKPLLV